MSETGTEAGRDRQTRCVIGGASPDTANLGVSALGLSVLAALTTRLKAPDLTVLDNGKGLSKRSMTLHGQPHEITLCGARHSRRYHRPDTLWTMRLAGRLGGLGNPIVRHLGQAHAWLDISGGDSFTDMYGLRRFQGIALQKQIALEQQVPLLLLPQTYGPFRTEPARRLARDLVTRAHSAWARDTDSYAALQELLGDAFDPERHRLGVDVAFSLPEEPPTEQVTGPAAAWRAGHASPLVGLNVSGLLLNNPDQAASQYELRADYHQAIARFVRRLLDESDARLLLVPHVVSPPGHYESDIAACHRIAGELDASDRQRVAVLPRIDDPREIKWIIARCDWFCGTRMHSTIAALSSGVPTAAIAYSMKTRGVFASVDQAAHVADPRSLDTADIVDQLWQSWLSRDEAKQALAHALPAVKQQAETQMDEIVAAISPGTCPPATVATQAP
ncbi:MAG: polysaccharide pyruvyl transferase family protein [Phycisphaerae bacterium]